MTLDGNHLVASFDYFARKLDATIDGDSLTGTYGAATPSKRASTPTTFTAKLVTSHPIRPLLPTRLISEAPGKLQRQARKGEKAWELRVDPPADKSPVIKAAIQRIDGDTGGLWGTWNGTAYVVGHFNASGGAAYSITPQTDGTLNVRSLLGGVHGSSPDLVARKPEEARKLNLAAPTEITQQTTVKNPNVPLAFSFPDLSGKVVSNTDPLFKGKVVIVAIGGSWCLNCHDEAHLLVSLYKRFHSKGLEIVNLDFEQGDPELILKDAPFNKRDAQLVPTAGSCADCPKRTGHNKLLFGDDLGKQGDQCTDPTCYQAKVEAHVAKTIAAKPELVQISTAYGVQSEGSPVLTRNKYVALRDERPKSNDEAKRPEFKQCKYTTEAIITEGSDVGSIHKVCANSTCPVHHPKQTSGRDEARWKAEQEKQRRDQAIANATGLRVLSAVAAAVPVRLLKRDLFFVIEKLVTVLDEPRIETLARQHGIRQKRDEGGVAKTLLAFMRRTDEGTLSRLPITLVPDAR